MRISAIIIFAGIIIAYSIFRSLNYARGPKITIDYPPNWSSASTSVIHIVGRVERVTDISLNGSSISVDEKGNFNVPIIIFPGSNRLVIAAKDQFGRITSTKLDIFGSDIKWYDTGTPALIN